MLKRWQGALYHKLNDLISLILSTLIYANSSDTDFSYTLRDTKTSDDLITSKVCPDANSNILLKNSKHLLFLSELE